MSDKPIDQLIELFSVICLILLFFLPFYFMGDLPGKIPSHFNGVGEADGFGGKNSIWVLPVVGLGVYVLLTFLNRFLTKTEAKPKSGQTQAVAEAQKEIAIEMMSTLKVSILGSFVYIVWATIQTALGNYDGLGSFFTAIFMGLILGITGYYIFKMISVKEEK